MGDRPQSRIFVILDRDGTLIEECNYLSEPEQIKLLPGVGEALREFQRLGYGLVIITNQSGVGQGYFDAARLELIHARLLEKLLAEGVEIDGIYVCPHKPDEGCLCRKPEIGLIQLASEQLGFKPSRSMVVGDKLSDMEMGRRVGATTVLVRTGYGAQLATDHPVIADYIVDDLPAAAALIRALGTTGGSCS